MLTCESSFPGVTGTRAAVCVPRSMAPTSLLASHAVRARRPRVWARVRAHQPRRQAVPAMIDLPLTARGAFRIVAGEDELSVCKPEGGGDAAPWDATADARPLGVPETATTRTDREVRAVDLAGRRALVTGGGAGLGEVIAATLA